MGKNKNDHSLVGQQDQLVVTQTRHGRLIPVTKWVDHHDWPSIGGIRYLVFNEHANGFAHCIIRIGRRVLIDENKFFEWAESHRPPPQIKR
jgi:hypothetical protein